MTDEFTIEGANVEVGEALNGPLEFTIVFETDDRITMAPTDTPDEAVTLERQR